MIEYKVKRNKKGFHRLGVKITVDIKDKDKKEVDKKTEKVLLNKSCLH